MKWNILVLTGVSALLSAGFFGCKKYKLDCAVATVEAYSTPEDSIGFGRWDWVYTVKWVKDWQDQWVVADTLLPGEPVAGYESLDFVHGTLDEGEICFNMSGKVINGCYEDRNSALFHTSTGPTDTVVRCLYQAWDSPLDQLNLSLDVYLPIIEGVPITARMGLRLFPVEDEDAEGIRYRNFFVKVK